MSECCYNYRHKNVKTVILTRYDTTERESSMCIDCFNIFKTNYHWVSKKLKQPSIIDTLKNPREAVMF